MTAANGAAAGAIATVVMSVPMLVARRLRIIDRQPPQEITGNVAEAARLPVSRTPLRLAAAVAHLGFGAVSGAIFAMAVRRIGPADIRPMGPIYGLLIWLLGYRGFLPRMGLVRGTEDAGAARDAVMLLAHLVFGAVLGRLVGWSERDRAATRRNDRLL